jgi:plasmid stabilization system protein ParE
MNILCTPLYETQLKEILSLFADEDFKAAKAFKLYLDTIIINIQTKAHKYKSSIYFDDENIRDIQHEAYTIVFYEDRANQNYLLISILKR